MDIMDMESVMLMLSQKPRPMLSMVLMEDMVLDTMLMVMEILATLLLAMAMDMVLAMALTEDMVLDTVLMVMEILATLLLVMVMDMVLAMALMDMDRGMDMDIMVELSDTTNQAWHYNDQVPPLMHDGPNIFLVCFKYSFN